MGEIKTTIVQRTFFLYLKVTPLLDTVSRIQTFGK